MKLLIAFLITLFVSPSFAQTGTAKNTNQLNTEVNTSLSNNTVITPTVMRQILLDIIASSLGPQSGVSAPVHTLLSGPATGTVSAAPTFRSLVAADLPPNLVESSLGFTPQQIFNVADFGAVGNGTTDDTQPFRNAAASCKNAGGGQIVLGPKRYLIDSNLFTVGTGCQVYCPTPIQVDRGTTGQVKFTTMPYTIILNPVWSIVMEESSGWSGCSLLQKGIASLPNNSVRAMLDIQAAFSGTGITLGATGAKANDITIRDAFIAGFACGIRPGGETCGSRIPSGTAANIDRLFIEHVNVDANNCLWIDDSHDISNVNTFECFPFLINATPYFAEYVITDIADNGAGRWRVTTSAPTIINTNDTVWVDSGINGAQSSIGHWTATVIDTTHVDLQGSDSNGVTPTGNTVNGQTMVTGMSSLAGIGVGSTVSGTGIPGGTTVSAILQTGNAIVLSQAATATNAGVTLTIADTAWSAGGILWIDASWRNGVGIEFSNSERMTCTACFVYNHSISFYVSTGGVWFGFIACTRDYNAEIAADNSVYGVLLDSTAKGANFVGFTSAAGRNTFVVNSTTGQVPHSISAGDIDATGSSGAVMLELDQGSVSLTGNVAQTTNRYVTIKDTAGKLVMTGNDIQNKFSAQDGTALNKVISSNNNNGHVAVPTPSACGTGPATFTQSTDYSGRILEGTAATGCIITFAQAFYDTPVCTISPQGVLTTLAYSVTSTAITITHDAASSISVNYSCTSREGR